MTRWVLEQFTVSIRLACECFTVSESGYQYAAKTNGESAPIVDWLLRLSGAHKRRCSDSPPPFSMDGAFGARRR